MFGLKTHWGSVAHKSVFSAHTNTYHRSVGDQKHSTCIHTQHEIVKMFGVSFRARFFIGLMIFGGTSCVRSSSDALR